MKFEEILVQIQYILNRYKVVYIIFSWIYILLYSCDSSIEADEIDGSLLWFTNLESITQTKATPPANIYISQQSNTFDIIKEELISGLRSIFNTEIQITSASEEADIIVATNNWNIIHEFISPQDFAEIGKDGFIIKKIPFWVYSR